MLMRRFSLSAVAVGVAAIGIAATTPASADPPISPVDTGPITFEAGVACSFPVEVTFSGQQGDLDLGGQGHFDVITLSPGFTVTFTNAETGASASYSATGSFHETVNVDGTTTYFATGHNVLFFPELGVTAILTTGPVTFTTNAADLVVSYDLSRAQVTDICAAIS
jgi:hypothetical protein